MKTTKPKGITVNKQATQAVSQKSPWHGARVNTSPVVVMGDSDTQSEMLACRSDHKVNNLTDQHAEPAVKAGPQSGKSGRKK